MRFRIAGFAFAALVAALAIVSGVSYAVTPVNDEPLLRASACIGGVKPVVAFGHMPGFSAYNFVTGGDVFPTRVMFVQWPGGVVGFWIMPSDGCSTVPPSEGNEA